MKEKPLILLTNDDGVDAPGIRALAEALEDLGDVYTVAPDEERSACSHSLNIKTRPAATAVEDEDRVYQVDGTTADCVFLAIREVLPREPKLVVSGINLGPNLGDDYQRSGTVAGAREGAFHEIPAIAISLVVGKQSYWDLMKQSMGLGGEVSIFGPAASWARAVAAVVLDEGMARRQFLNVNVPAGVPKELRVTALDPPHEEADQRLTPLTDRAAVSLGYVSLTPLHPDATDYSRFDAVRQRFKEIEVESRAIGRT